VPVPSEEHQKKDVFLSYEKKDIEMNLAFKNIAGKLEGST